MSILLRRGLHIDPHSHFHVQDIRQFTRMVVLCFGKDDLELHARACRHTHTHSISLIYTPCFKPEDLMLMDTSLLFLVSSNHTLTSSKRHTGCLSVQSLHSLNAAIQPLLDARIFPEIRSVSTMGIIPGSCQVGSLLDTV